MPDLNSCTPPEQIARVKDRMMFGIYSSFTVVQFPESIKRVKRNWEVHETLKADVG